MEKRQMGNLQMEQVVHKIRYNAQPVVRRVVVAEGRQFTSLQAIERGPLLRVQVRTVGIQPSNRLARNLVAIWMIDEREGAMRDEVGEDERGSWSSLFNALDLRWRS